MRKHWILWVLAIFICACSPQDEKEKHQSSRNNIVDVKSLVKEVDTGDVLLGRHTSCDYSKDYLILTDYDGWEGVVHLFDKKDFHHIISTGKKGEGPDELINPGSVFIDEARKKLYITDNSKYKVFSYDLDSIIAIPETYKHQEKAKIRTDLFPVDIKYINDTLSYGCIIKPTSFNSFDQMIGKWNMMTGELEVIGEKHPEVHRKRSNIAVSMEKNMIVEAYHNYDLMNISDLDGNIKCYIYGPDWTTKGLMTFSDVMITPNHILVEYSGEEWSKAKTYYIHVFDLKGNYLKTLDIGYEIWGVSYDETNHRLFMVFNDEIQFGYLDLKGII